MAKNTDNQLVLKQTNGAAAWLMGGLLWVLLAAGCRSLPPASYQYQAPWPEASRRYLGPAYWANALMDWRVAQGAIFCQRAQADRSVVLLTRAAAADSGDLYLSAHIHLMAPPDPPGGQRYLGFQLGRRGPRDDYRSAATQGRGLAAGLTTGGELFIGQPEQAEAISPLDMRLPWELRLRATPEPGGYRLTLSVHDPSTGRRLEHLTRDSVALTRLQGQMALLCHLPGSDSTTRGAVARFSQWQLGGSLLRHFPERALGPIAFARHSIDRDRLYLAAHLMPVNPAITRLVRLELDRGQGFELVKEASLDSLTRTARFEVADWQPRQPVPYRLSCQLDTDTGLHRSQWVDTLAPVPEATQPLTLALLDQPQAALYPYQELVAQLVRDADGWAIPLPVPFQATDDLRPDQPALLAYLEQWYRLGWMLAPLWGRQPGWLTLPATLPPGWAEPLGRLQAAGHPPASLLPTEQQPGGYLHCRYGGLSLALVDDRPLTLPRLGADQLAFLQAWARDWSGQTRLKVVLGTRPWVGPAQGTRLPWEPALWRLREGLALQVMMPQDSVHFSQYRLGPESPMGFGFAPPSLGAEPGDDGYGLLQLDMAGRHFVAQARALPGYDPANLRFGGFPESLRQVHAYGQPPLAWLPPLVLTQTPGQPLPVVQVIDESTQRVIYTRRLPQARMILPVYASGSYTLRLFEPDGGPASRVWRGLQAETQKGQGDILRLTW